MNLAPLAVIFLAVLAAGYVLYGRFIARQFRLDAGARTPAQELNDGVDYVPTKPFYLMGQHFAAIAAAGPIVGPIMACQQFGWLPCLLWIGLGVVLIGAVHDFAALVASVRHRGRSIAEVVRENLGRRAWLAMMCFIWIALVYVIVAFADLTAGTFVGRIEELGGRTVGFERGGAVAFASIAYLTLALVMGVVQRRWNPPLWILTLVFVPATLGVVWLGTQCSTWFLLSQKAWGAVILGYCFVASLLPVWLLLQPRGYLGGFVLYMVLAVGVIGVFFGGFGIEQPKFKGWEVQGSPTGVLFPFLFVTIACGACSGFHGLVCSGTTSKQIANEKDCRPIGYGGMLLEAFVALIALATVMIVAQPAGAPGATYGQGIGRFLTVLIGEENLLFAIIFGSMAFSTFVFDTIDVATRLGRYIVQELFNVRTRVSAVVATLATLATPLFLILAAEPAAPGKPAAYMAFWTLFGTSNQLLAALTLLGVSVWLFRKGKPTWFTLLPMLFVMTITTWALVIQAMSVIRAEKASGVMVANSAVAVVLLGLAGVLIVESIRAVRRHVATAGR